MPKVEQVKTILNFKSNKDNVRDAMCSYIKNICVASKIIWPSSMHHIGCTVPVIVTNKYVMSYVREIYSGVAL